LSDGNELHKLSSAPSANVIKKRFTKGNICATLEKYLQKTVNYCKIKSIYKIVKQNKSLRVRTFVLFLVF
jgi:hypothetical protein